MISQLEERLSLGFQSIDLNQRKWFMKPNGTIFALIMTDTEDAIIVLYTETVMNAAIHIYNSSDPVSIDLPQNEINMQLSQIIMSI